MDVSILCILFNDMEPGELQTLAGDIFKYWQRCVPDLFSGNPIFRNQADPPGIVHSYCLAYYLNKQLCES